MQTIAPATAIHFRGELRRARERALSDGENYQHILFAVERLGRQSWPNRNALGGFACRFRDLVKQHHPLAGEGADDHELAFERRYHIVREAKNDAMHIGTANRREGSRSV